MTTDEMEGVFNLILASWPTQRQKLAEDDITWMAEAYSAGLTDLEFAVARAAVIRVQQTSKWLPTVAEIREAAGVVKYGHTRSGGEAWGDVHIKIRRYGWNRPPGAEWQFEDPIVAECVAALGWLDICETAGSAGGKADRARFIDMYDILADRQRKDAATRPGVALLPNADAIPIERRLPERKVIASASERSQLTRAVLAEVLASTNDPDVRALAGQLPVLPASSCECTNDLGVAVDGRCRACGAKRAA